MKKILLSACMLCCIAASAQVISIPDVNFKNKLISFSTAPATIGSYAKDVNGQYMVVDTNADGEISQSEALQVYELTVRQSSIGSFAGVEYFTNLRILDCSINGLTALNLTGLVNLVELNVYLCGISSLDLSGSLYLEKLNCNGNNLTALDVSMLTYLKELDCSNNHLTTLDLNANTNLTTLSFFSNNLVSLFIKNGQNENIDPAGWIENPQLEFVCCDDSQIAGIIAEEYFSSEIQISANCSLSVPGFEKDNSVKVYPNPSNGLVKIDADTEIKSIYLYDIQGDRKSVV